MTANGTANGTADGRANGTSLANGTTDGTATSNAKVKLNVSVVGAGMGGLTAALVLARDGHKVTVYEHSAELSELGAGLSQGSNGTRIMVALGLLEEFNKVVFRANCISMRRWADNTVLGEVPENPHSDWVYEAPNWKVSRPDIQRVLYDAALAAGVTVLFGKLAISADTEKGTLFFEDGLRADADLVVASDGIRSRLRACLPQTAHIIPKPHRQHMYRFMIPTERILAEPELVAGFNRAEANAWLGPDLGVLTYPVSAGHWQNFVVMVPRPNEHAEPGQWKQPGDIAEMRALFKGWHSVPSKLVHLVQECIVWTIADVAGLPTYVSDSGRFCLIGDAAHAFVPHAGQGANQSLEDAVALSAFIRSMDDISQLPKTLKAWSDFRIPRVENIRRLASGAADAWILHDGPQQQARDKMVAAQTAQWKGDVDTLGQDGLRKKMIANRPKPDENAKTVFEAGAQEYMYGYNIFEESDKYIKQHLAA